MRSALLFPLLLAAAGAQAQIAFPAPGAKAVLTVEYVYKSEGREADKHDSRDWRVLRGVSMSATLVAARPTTLSSVNAPEAAQLARNERAVAQGEAIAAHLGGSLAGLQAAIEKCGDDEACLQKVATQMASAGAARPRAETQRLARETETALKPGAVRYQLWKAAAQQGTYTVSEDVKIVHTDPICLEGPGLRCHRSEERRGNGALAAPAGSRPAEAAGFAHAELDAEKRTLSLRLPVPTSMLAVTETVVTDEPQHTRGRASVRLQSGKQLDFRALRDIAPFTVALKGDGAGGWHSQTGEFVIDVKGEREERGRLAVRWAFTAR